MLKARACSSRHILKAYLTSRYNGNVKAKFYFTLGLIGLGGFGCTTNMATIDLVTSPIAPPSPGVSQLITRDLSAQGAGNINSYGGGGDHQIVRTTVGGSYLRRQDLTSPGHKLRAGMFSRSQ